MTTTSRLVVVSNRLPFTVSPGPDGELQRQASAGGLVTAVAPVVSQSGGLWLGWAGPHLPPDCPLPEAPHLPDNSGLLSSQVLPVHLTDQVSILMLCPLCLCEMSKDH